MQQKTMNDFENKLSMEILKLLRKADNGIHQIALPMGIFEDEAMDSAVDRCCFNQWIMLIDVRPVQGKSGIYRIFCITEEGIKQQKLIEEFFNPIALGAKGN